MRGCFWPIVVVHDRRVTARSCRLGKENGSVPLKPALFFFGDIRHLARQLSSCPTKMKSRESRLSNRILIATAVLFAAALFWLSASALIASLITGKVWLSLVAASVFIADKGYMWLCRRNARE
jgi:hypothetical protein